ncbi:hypothetical protein DOTSEDRAFT_36906 [Dothistroma septosporum NZE10]|uniref:Uncharacterized protein n=1 Tax=Dothistroma septosporum (strain NZE10 / CBS 128990) TaxID=675120 RepID=N1PIZ5_DOTSN|nr:hypothetical protein DOTSEDRAFT_36906 [Dothistroma septosporum NZE10]
MAVRINQCARGHSTIRPHTIDCLLKLVTSGITPIVPLRGSISASGDLMHLVYVVGLLEGSPDVYVTRDYGDLSRIMSAHEALAEVRMRPVTLVPREGLGLVNGTAASAAIASLAISDAMHLTLLATRLTPLTFEGMAARVDWLHPFIAEMSTHPGQAEAARIM